MIARQEKGTAPESLEVAAARMKEAILRVKKLAERRFRLVAPTPREGQRLFALKGLDGASRHEQRIQEIGFALMRQFGFDESAVLPGSIRLRPQDPHGAINGVPGVSHMFTYPSTTIPGLAFEKIIEFEGDAVTVQKTIWNVADYSQVPRVRIPKQGR